MDEQPKKLETKRRWFRFRLSTVLILTAIAAWGMAKWPDVDFEKHPYSPGPGQPTEWVLRLRFWTPTRYYSTTFWLDPAIAYPALALAAFLAWKAAWAVVERRRRRFAA